MKTISLKDSQRPLGYYLKWLQQEGDLLIIEKGKPIARLVDASHDSLESIETNQEISEEFLVPSKFLDPDASVRKALKEEREASL